MRSTRSTPARSMPAVLATLAVLVLTGLLGATGHGTAATAPSSGFNDWSCQPSAARPYPVVALHGLGGNGPGNFAYLGPKLAAAGYCVFAPTYGQATPAIPVGGTVPVAESAGEIAAFINRVLAGTGAAKVNLVGHSEGGFHALYGPKILGYHAQVSRVVALAPPTHGTTVQGLVPIGDFLGLRPLVDRVLAEFGCGACADVIVGGPAVTELTAGPIAQGGVDYTVIATRWDLIVTPQETSFVPERGVHNAFVQDTCPFDPVGHVGLAFDSTVAQLVVNALDPTSADRVRCGFGPPL